MNKLNQEFFNEYSRLDKLCKELYRKNSADDIMGVTSYINDMKSTPAHISRTVADWDKHLRSLIYIRHIRNTLAHEPDAFKKITCTRADIDCIHYFYKSITESTDPISQARKSPRKAKTKSKIISRKNKRRIRSLFRFLISNVLRRGIRKIR